MGAPRSDRITMQTASSCDRFAVGIAAHSQQLGVGAERDGKTPVRFSREFTLEPHAGIDERAGDALCRFARGSDDGPIARTRWAVQVRDGALHIALGVDQRVDCVDGGDAGALTNFVDAFGSNHVGTGMEKTVLTKQPSCQCFVQSQHQPEIKLVAIAR